MGFFFLPVLACSVAVPVSVPVLRLVLRFVLSSSRFPPRLACRGAGRCRSRRFPAPSPSSLPPLSSYRSCVSSCLSRGETNAVARVVGLFLVRMRGVVVLVSSPVPCLLVEGRGGVCVGVVDCPIRIYNLPVSWYLIGVEREQAPTERKSRNDDRDQHPHRQHPLL